MNRIAIIVPSLDRHHFIHRLVNYYGFYNNICNVYIGDSSIKKIKKNLKNKIDEFNFKYFHIPGMNDREAILYLATQVKEELTTFSGDDDFFIIESLIKGANILKKNKQYRTVQGKHIIFTQNNEDLNSKIKNFFLHSHNNNIENDTALSRVIKFSKKYFVTQFSIHRTSGLIEDSKEFVNCKNRQLGEMTHCFTTILRGKSKNIPDILLLRQHHINRNKSSISISEKLNFKNFMIERKNHNPKIFLRTLESELSRIDKLNKNEISLHVSNILSNFFKNKNNLKIRIKQLVFVMYKFFFNFFRDVNIYSIKYSFYLNKKDINILRKFVNNLEKSSKDL